MVYEKHTYEAYLAFLERKYMQTADARQKAMGLSYTEAETHDLAKELANYIFANPPNPWHKIADNPPPEETYCLFAYWHEVDKEWCIDNHTYDEAKMVEGIKPYTHWQHLTTPDSVGS